MQTANITDEHLMLRYRDGDYAAFETLYQRHSRGLLRFISWHSPRADWADEVAQDAWLRLHHARESYEPQASFKTLLYQIARNRLIDLLRQKRPLLASELGDDEDGDTFGHLADMAAQDDAPETGLAQKQLNDRLHRAIGQLPQEQREALVLHQFSELTLAEIALLTGTKEETVKGRLRYSMQKLKVALTD